MGNNENQLGLFANQAHVLELPDADVVYTANFYGVDQAQHLFDRLLTSVDWRQERIKVYGKTHLTPRLSCWMGEEGLDYRYANLTMIPVPWSETLLSVKSRLEGHTSDTFNSVLINYYRNGQDSNSWHSDDEPELGENPTIASISLGASRDFQLRHKKTSQKASIKLEHGSLLIMRGTTQQCWQHQIPKRASVGGRINLTFRTIKRGR